MAHVALGSSAWPLLLLAPEVYMRLAPTPTAIGLILRLAVAPAYAGQKGNAGKGGPKTTTHGPSTTHGSSSTTHGPSTTHGSSAKSTTTKTHKPDTQVANASSKPGKSKTTTSTTSTGSTGTGSTTTSTSPTTTTAIDFTASANGQKLSKNSALRSKLETRL